MRQRSEPSSLRRNVATISSSELGRSVRMGRSVEEGDHDNHPEDHRGEDDQSLHDRLRRGSPRGPDVVVRPRGSPDATNGYGCQRHEDERREDDADDAHRPRATRSS